MSFRVLVPRVLTSARVWSRRACIAAGAPRARGAGRAAQAERNTRSAAQQRQRTTHASKEASAAAASAYRFPARCRDAQAHMQSLMRVRVRSHRVTHSIHAPSPARHPPPRVVAFALLQVRRARAGGLHVAPRLARVAAGRRTRRSAALLAQVPRTAAIAPCARALADLCAAGAQHRGNTAILRCAHCMTTREDAGAALARSN
jgi:hypothetical protein